MSDQEQPGQDPAAENTDAPNDAPGSASATPGSIEPSEAPPGHRSPPGIDRPGTGETRSEAQRTQPSQEPAALAPQPASAPAPAGEVAAEQLHGCPVASSLGATVVHCNREDYLRLCGGLAADGYAMPVGVTGVDYLTHPGRVLPPGIRAERFEVVVELLSLADHKRVRVRCQVPASDPRVPSLFRIWPGTEAHERETYDMFGINFEGHPDPSRILMPEDWEGHPLRKDYDTGHVPIQFKEAPR